MIKVNILARWERKQPTHWYLYVWQFRSVHITRNHHLDKIQPGERLSGYLKETLDSFRFQLKC